MGNTPDADLRRIVTATDGQCYQISHLGEGAWEMGRIGRPMGVWKWLRLGGSSRLLRG